MCTTPHNPNNVDLGKDVLFRLITPEKGAWLRQSIDQNVWEPLDRAIELLEEAKEGILFDQKIRIEALKCWMMTQRNVAAWVNYVYGYMESADSEGRALNKEKVKGVILAEVKNTKALLNLLDSGIEFMAVTEKGETPLVYGDNLTKLLMNKLALMEQHMDDDPFIDHNYIERKAGEPIT